MVAKTHVKRGALVRFISQNPHGRVPYVDAAIVVQWAWTVGGPVQHLHCVIIE